MKSLIPLILLSGLAYSFSRTFIQHEQPLSSETKPVITEVKKEKVFAHSFAEPAVSDALIQVKAKTTPSHWEDLWWLDRASRALRGGDSLAAIEDPEVLLAKGKEEIVKEFMDDPRFGDTVLDFNMGLLGFRQDRVHHSGGSYSSIVFVAPHAVRSAQAMTEPKGNYFSLFDLQFPLYMGPLNKPFSKDPSDQGLDDETVRARIISRLQAQMDKVIELAGTTPLDPKAVCDALGEQSKEMFSNSVGLPYPFPFNIVYQAEWYGRLLGACADIPAHLKFDFLGEAQHVKAQNTIIFSKLVDFEPSHYKTTKVTDIKALDLSEMKIAYQNTAYNVPIAVLLPNSSTNFDRKRSAYILKHFFCDDLTPIKVEAPAIHAGGAHASDPACIACHYKLDPMAGFFRDFGLFFRDFSQEKKIQFDDFAEVPREEYEKAWQPGPDADHPWNVGYIRSSTNPKLNTYGSTITDLYKILKRAPEVKRCIVRRMFEYFVSEDQTLDGSYLDYLTAYFEMDSKFQNSAQAVRNTAARLVLSKSFGTPNADPNQCYDYRPGTTPSSRAPCKISSVISTSCIQCHQSVREKPFLDLTGWEMQSDGKMGFPHLDQNGKAIPAGVTFQQMLERLSSTDSTLRMPYLSEMPDTDRSTLYQWLDLQTQKNRAGVK